MYKCLGTLDWTVSKSLVSVDARKLLDKTNRKFPQGQPPTNDLDVGIEVVVAVPALDWNPTQHYGHPKDH